MTPDTTAPPPISYRRLSLGLNLMGFGTFLLLTTQGVLPWSFWMNAALFWPVLLVGVGLRLVFERSSMPWAMLASPLLIHGTLAMLAMRPPPPFEGTWSEVRAERPKGAERFWLEGRVALARLEIRAQDLTEDVLVEGRAASSDGRAHMSVGPRSDGARVRFGHDRNVHVFRSREQQRWELGISRALPVEFALDGAFLRGTTDLRGSQLRGLSIDGAFNSLELHLPEVEEDVRLSLDGAFNDYALFVPASTPVRVDTDGALLSVDGRRGAGDLTGPGYRLQVSGFASNVEVRSER